MELSIGKNENLWNIVQLHNNYFKEKINTFAENFDIKAGEGIISSGIDCFVKEVKNINQTRKFDNWTTEKTFEKMTNGEDVGDFQMFEYNEETYAQDLEKFAQTYIDKYDKDGDGNLSYDEAAVMYSHNNKDTEDNNCKEVSDAFYQLAAASLNTNPETDDVIDAGELAAMLYSVDTNNGTTKADGTFDLESYQSGVWVAFDKNAENILSTRKDFYNENYANKQKEQDSPLKQIFDVCSFIFDEVLNIIGTK